MRIETRVDFLDGVRGFAALWVLLGHAANCAEVRIPVISDNGLAVDVFMVLSGFLMTQHYFIREVREPWEEPRTWLAFYIRRFFRVAPLYYLLLLPCFLGFNYFRAIEQLQFHRIFSVAHDPTVSSLNLASVVLHLTFLFGLLPQYSSSLVIPDWSIGLEMQFYAIFPFLMLALRKLNLALISLLLLGVWIESQRVIGVYITSPPHRFGLFPEPSFFPLKAGLFLIGILIGWAYMEDNPQPSRNAATVVIAVCVASLCNRIVFVVICLMIALLFYDERTMRIGIAKPVRFAKRLLTNRVARFLGDVSYGAYLLHKLILIPLSTAVKNIDSPTIRFGVLAVLGLALTYPSAWLLLQAVEKPGIKLGKLLVTRLQTKAMIRA